MRTVENDVKARARKERNAEADERFDDLDRAALLRFTGFCHKNAPIIKRKRTLRPTFSKIIIEH